MNTKTALSVLAVLTVLIGAYYYLAGDAAVQGNPAVSNEAPVSAMRVAGNAIVVVPQKEGSDVLISQAYLSSSGFIAIHEDANGVVGVGLGTSGLLQPGEQASFKIALSRATKNGEKLHATMMADTDGSGTPTAGDMPMESGLGGAIDAWFEIDNAAVEGEVVI